MQTEIKSRPVQFSLHPATYKKLLEFATHIHCDSETGRPMAATAAKKVLRSVLNLYSDAAFLRKLESEGGDTLSFILKCVNKEIRQDDTDKYKLRSEF